MSPTAAKPKARRDPSSGDVGWRKAAVTALAIVALVTLQLADRLTTDVALYILGAAGAFIGANLAGHLRGPRPGA